VASDLYSGTYGSFHHEYIAVKVSGSLGDVLSTPTVRVPGGDKPEEEFEKVMQELAYQHEIRHFHDCFGTLGGISMFLSYVCDLREFGEINFWLRERHLSWRLPLNAWVHQKDCPLKVKKFYWLSLSRRFHRDLFLGALPTFAYDGSTEAPWEWIKIDPPCPMHEEAPSIPAFPMQVRQSEQGNREIVSTYLYPLSLSTLLEGNAQAIQRTLLETKWPHLAKEYWRRMTERNVNKTADSKGSTQAGLWLLPYNVTDYLLTKYFEQRRGSPLFPISLILKVTDAALMTSLAPSCHWPYEKIHRHSGTAFVDVLGATNWKGDLDKVTISTPISSSELKDIVSVWKATIPEMDSPRIKHPIDVIESYVIHRIVIPLLDLRVRYGGSVFSDHECYMKHFDEFPLPPTIFSDRGPYSNRVAYSDRGATYSEECQEMFLKNWAHYVMLQNMMTAILNATNPVIPCPRAYKLIPGIEYCELAHPPGSCDNFVRDRECMFWSQGFRNKLPTCLFSRMLEELGLE
jgi:hypothetical protein